MQVETKKQGQLYLYQNSQKIYKYMGTKQTPEQPVSETIDKEISNKWDATKHFQKFIAIYAYIKK